MFIRTVNRQTITDWSYVAALVASILLLLTYPDAIRTGISRGLSICTTVIVPTLYPFMVISGLLAESPLSYKPGHIISGLSRRLFGLPGCCGTVIILSFLGGYPAGAVAMSRLYKQGRITDEQLQRMTAFCVVGGPGFVITTVGSALLGSIQAGGILYLSQAVTAIGIGMFLGRKHHHIQDSSMLLLPSRRPIAYTVSDTCEALLSMCGFVVLSTMGLALAEGCGLIANLATSMKMETSTVSAIIAAFTEVSCGCLALTGGGTLMPLWLSLALSWGGLSVHGQLAAILPQQNIIGFRFWGWRLIHGTLSGSLAMVLFSIFPIYQDVLVDHTVIIPYSVSMAATLMLLLLSFLSMLCFSEKSKFSGFSQKSTGNMV